MTMYNTEMSQENVTKILRCDACFMTKDSTLILSPLHMNEIWKYAVAEGNPHVGFSGLALSWGKEMFSSSELQKNEANCQTIFLMAVINM